MKKISIGILILLFITSAAKADLYTQTLKIGDDSETFTQYKENKDNSFYKIEKSPQNQNQPTNTTIVVPYHTVEYVPVNRYPYTFSTYSTYYYPTTSMGIHIGTSPYRCFKAPCHPPRPPVYPGHRPPSSQGGLNVYTNFAGGYSFGGDTRTWSSTRFPGNRPMRPQPR